MNHNDWLQLGLILLSNVVSFLGGHKFGTSSVIVKDE